MADRKVIGEKPDINFLSGTAKPGPYVTTLGVDDESKFQRWTRENRVPWKDEPNADYDMRGFWKASQSGDPRARTEVNPYDRKLHFTDAWKTPHHDAFSRESIYATQNAPVWHEGGLLKDKLGRVVYDDKTGKKVNRQITIKQMQRR